MDAFSATQDQYQIINDQVFTPEVASNYTKSDGLTADNRLLRASDIDLVGDSIMLGASDLNKQLADARVNRVELSGWEEDLTHAIAAGN